MGDKELVTTAINNATKEIKQHCNLLKDISVDMHDIYFIYSDKITNITQLLPNLGAVSVTKSPSQPDAKTIAVYTGELRPRTISINTKNPDIKSYEMLPDGRQLIADYNNNKMKLYDSNNQYLSELVLPDSPLSVVILSETEAMLSLPNITSLQYINIDTHLSLSQTIKVNYEPLAMVKYGDDILATVYDMFWKVLVMDNNGTVKRKIYQGNGSIFIWPYFIGLSVDQKTVYVVDEVKGCIGLTMNGNVVFQYRDPKVDLYVRLGDGRDCLLIGVSHGKMGNVRRLSLSDKCVEDLNLGDSWPLKIIDNRLIIQNTDDQGELLIKFFRLL